MKNLRNRFRSVSGISRRMYAIIKNKRGYHYYLRTIWSSDLKINIHNSIEKSKVLTKFTLPVLGVLYSLYFVLLYAISPVYLYLNGGFRFVKDGFEFTNVKFFGWVNLIVMTILIIVLI